MKGWIVIAVFLWVDHHYWDPSMLEMAYEYILEHVEILLDLV